ncbi:MAG: HD domain-containing protein [Xanthobacteraceae bacterium]
MITVPELAAEALGSFLSNHLERRFGSTEAGLTELISWVSRLALECIGNSDALYHTVEHTMLVTLVGYDIMKGRSLLMPTSAEEYAHVIVACLLHDIGYVRGVLMGDSENSYVIDAKGSKAKLPRGASDAALTPHHVDRSKLFALDRLSNMEFIDADRVARAIEFTRFPSAIDPAGQDVEEGSLVRAADLIGQLGDPHYLRKANALYYEFEEVGMNKQLGYASPADLTDLYPQFYYNSIAPHIQTAIRYLNVTSSGRQWIASLYSNVFRAESELSLSGPER